MHKGIHILSQMKNCQFDFSLEYQLPEIFSKFCTEVGLSVVGLSQHKFQPQGITFAILLAESHMSVHTWPEDNMIYLDIFTCNHENDNTAKAIQLHKKIKEIFKPYTFHEQFIER